MYKVCGKVEETEKTIFQLRFLSQQHREGEGLEERSVAAASKAALSSLSSCP